MTEMLDAAIAAVRRLSSDRQDAIATAMMGLADIDFAAEAVDPTHRAAIAEGLAQIQRGEFATDEEVAAAFLRFGA